MGNATRARVVFVQSIQQTKTGNHIKQDLGVEQKCISVCLWNLCNYAEKRWVKHEININEKRHKLRKIQAKCPFSAIQLLCWQLAVVVSCVEYHLQAHCTPCLCPDWGGGGCLVAGLGKTSYCSFSTGRTSSVFWAPHQTYKLLSSIEWMQMQSQWAETYRVRVIPFAQHLRHLL